MKRRRWLQIVAASGLLASAATWAVFPQITSALRASTGRLRRVPRDLVDRIRRRTRPLDPSRLHNNNDLLG